MDCDYVIIYVEDCSRARLVVVVPHTFARFFSCGAIPPSSSLEFLLVGWVMSDDAEMPCVRVAAKIRRAAHVCEKKRKTYFLLPLLFPAKAHF